MFASLQELQYPQFFSRITLKEARKGLPAGGIGGQGPIQVSSVHQSLKKRDLPTHSSPKHDFPRHDSPKHGRKHLYQHHYPQYCDLRMKQVGYLQSRHINVLLLARRVSCRAGLYYYRVILPNGTPYDLNTLPTFLQDGQYINIGGRGFRVNLASNIYLEEWIDG